MCLMSSSSLAHYHSEMRSMCEKRKKRAHNNWTQYISNEKKNYLIQMSEKSIGVQNKHVKQWMDKKSNKN